MKGKNILLSIILIIITLMCVVWAGLAVSGVEVFSQIKNVLHINAEAENIAFKNSSITLGVGQTSGLDVIMTPEDTDTAYTLSSSDSSVLKIEGTKAIALAKGDCTVKVKTENGLSDYCDVTVKEAPDKITIPANAEAAVGESFSLKPSDSKKMPNDFFTYTSDNNDVVSIKEDGSVRLMEEGKAVITVTTYNGLSKSCNVTALKAPTSVKFDEDSISITQKSTYQLSWEYGKGEGAREVTFTSSDEKIAKVNSKGVVTGVGQGEATITLETFNNLTAKCSVTVTNQFERIRTNLDSKKPMVCLTFDDGPKNSNTKSILNTLDKYHGRATFFVVGSRVEDEADVLLQEYKAGHEIGSHSWDHQYANNISKKTQQEELSKASKAIQDVLGVGPTLFRCPGGISCDVYENSNYPLIMWSIDTVDWSTKNTNETYKAIKNVFDKGESLDGDIVLMHDIQDSTPKAVEKICKLLDKKGYQIVTISEMAYYKNVQLQGGETYYNFYR